MRKLEALLLCFAMFIAGQAFSQTRQVRGSVTDSLGTPVPNASVQVANTKIGTRTNEAGSFALDVPANATLIFSSVGFQSTRYTVTGDGPINIRLTAGNQSNLQEVVVTAVGITRAQRSLGYSTSTLKSEELLKARETNVVNALAGKVAGVRINSQSGTVGGSSKIIIRGVNTVYSANGTGQPIFVIDGLPVDNSSQQVNLVNSAQPVGAGAIDFGNRAGDINPDDIENITVLKGAAATALYGARARDGAIIITTKKGKKGQTAVTLNSSVRWDNVLRLPDLQNEYAQGTQGVYNLASANGWGPKISDVQDKTFTDFMGRQVKLQAYPNNLKDFYQTGNTYINSIGFEGGGDGGDYRVGFTNTTQTGIVLKEKLNKNAVSVSAGRNFLPGLNVRANLNYIRTNSENRPFQGANEPNAIIGILAGLPRTVNIEDLRNNYYDPITKKQIPLTTGFTGNNPFWILNYNGAANTVDRFYGNAIVSYSPLEWLTISDNVGTDFYNDFRTGVTRNGTQGALTGAFFNMSIYNRIMNNDLLLTFTPKVSKDFGVKFIAGHNIYQNYYRRTASNATDLTVEELYTFTNAGNVTTTNTSLFQRLVGVFGDLSLSYKNFLFLDVTGRNDWISTLAPENRSYFYPSVSGSFVFSEVLPRPSWFDYGKLRASWANVGGGPAPYSLAFAYLSQSNAYSQYSLGTQFPYNGLLAFTVPGILPNADLKPQNQISYETGIEARFLKGRIGFDVNYYSTETRDQIVNISVPSSTGYTAKTVNVGSVKNSGIEATLNLLPLRTKDFNWGVDLNFAKNNQVVTLPKEVPTLTLSGGFSGLNVKAETGKSFGLYGRAWERDPQGNIVIDANTGLRKFKEDQRIGSIFPDWTMGINNSFGYKNFNLSFLIDIRQGGYIYSSTVSALRSGGLAEETLENRGRTFIDKGVVLDASTGKYVANTVPVQSMQDFWAQWGSQFGEANTFDASYVKLREMRISYKFPTAITSKIKFIKELELGLEGRNLWIIKSNVPHIDPEVNFFGNDRLGEGVEFYTLPSTRSYGVNLRIKL